MGFESQSNNTENLTPFENKQKDLLKLVDEMATRSESHTGSVLKMSHLEGWTEPLKKLLRLYEENPSANKGDAFKDLEATFERFRSFAGDHGRVEQDSYARGVVVEMSLRFAKLKPKAPNEEKSQG